MKLIRDAKVMNQQGCYVYIFVIPSIKMVMEFVNVDSFIINKFLSSLTIKMMIMSNFTDVK